VEVRWGREDTGTRSGEGGAKEGIEGGTTGKVWGKREGRMGWEGITEGKEGVPSKGWERIKATC
jgi:hypothetical protein